MRRDRLTIVRRCLKRNVSAEDQRAEYAGYLLKLRERNSSASVMMGNSMSRDLVFEDRKVRIQRCLRCQVGKVHTRLS
jgi:hypothetical protein